ncbi:tyrosine-tyramine antiporter [Cytobacillus sp. Hz8]|uniref:tyrosine-tyramine antiporter n=1 Tax=Cytobacillus sp. Hz8 TaxID=3347168 RepID=UPI0035DE09E7
MAKSKSLSLFGLIGITMAFFGTVRSVPTLAATGWTSIFYMFLASFLFALPITLLSAEFSTTFPVEGGPQVWVEKALGKKWGFVTSWLLWVQMFFGMVMVASTIGVLFGYVIGKPELASNNMFILATILICYWGITLLNIKFDMVKIAGNWGAVIGVYIPFLFLIGLGIAYMIKNGINPDGYLADFHFKDLWPDFSDLGSLTYLSGIMFIFTGVEISSVHVNKMENPRRNYPVGILFSVIAIIVLNLITGLTVADGVPNGKMELANITQPYLIFLKDFGLPTVLANIVSAMILIGVLTQLSAWVLGPSKSMLKVAQEGMLPPFFQKKTNRDIPITLVLIQAGVITVVSLAYLLIPNVSSAFLMITCTTTILYCIVYLLIGISAIRVRYTMPNIDRPFRVGNKGNGLMWVVAILSLASTLIAIAVSFIPPDIFKASQYPFYIGFQVVATLLMIGLALVIYKFKKPEWKISEVEEERSKAS